MNEKELTMQEIVAFINQHEGEVFVRITITEEGDLRGTKARSSSNPPGGR